MGFLDFLNSFTSSAASVQAQIAAVFNFLLNAIIVLFTFIYRLLVDVANFLYGILQKVGKFFRHIWDGFFKGVFNKVFTGILKAHDWLESHLRPIIQFLQKIRAYVDRIFKLYVKPFINLIQHVRRVLLVLRLFHIKFAQKLDQRLLQIEVRVAAVFIEARSILNNLIDTLNILIDPTKLLRHPTLVISIRRSLPAIIHSVTGVGIDHFFPNPDGTPIADASGLDKKVPFDFVSTADGASDDDLAELPPLAYFTEGYGQLDNCSSVFNRLYDALLRIEAGFSDAASLVGRAADKEFQIASDIYKELKLINSGM